MGLQKRGEEWEEYDHAVQWMSLTVIITLLVTIFLAVISMPLPLSTGASMVVSSTCRMA